MARRSLQHWLHGLWLPAALLAACGSPSSPAAPSTAGYPPSSFPTPIPITGYPAGTEAVLPPAGVNVPPEAAPVVTAATNDLAQRTGIAAGSIQVVAVTQQSWPDASLGCPLDGHLYAQVVTSGYRVVLDAGGQRYAYHTDLASAVLCEQDQP